MSKLSQVTEELAAKLLSEVDYSQRLQGTRYHAMAGGMPVVFLELQEAKEFLHVGSLQSLLTCGGGGTINYLDWTKLKTWIAEVFGDYELADSVGKEIAKGKSFVETMGPIKELLEERLQQCKSLLRYNEKSRRM